MALKLPKKDDRNWFQKGFDQVNPLDSGRSWQTSTPSMEQSQRSGLAQLGGIVAPTVGKTVNTIRGGIVTPLVGNVYSNVASGFGRDEEKKKAIQNAAYNESWNQLFGNNKGLFGVGSLYNNEADAMDTSAGHIAKKTLGTTLGVGSEILPIGAGARGLSTGAKVASTLVGGGVSSGMGSAGQQLVENGSVDPLATLKSVGIGAATAGVIPVAAKGVNLRAPLIPEEAGSLNPKGKSVKVLGAPKGEFFTDKKGKQVKVSSTADVKRGSDANTYMDSMLNMIGVEGPEVVARNKYRPSSISARTGELYRSGVDAVRDKTNDALMKGITSNNKILANATAAPNMVFNRYGMKDATRNIIRERNGQQENAGRVSVEVANTLGGILEKTKDPTKSLERIDRLFEEPDFLKRQYGTSNKVELKDLSPAEKHVVNTMVRMNKMRNDINLELGHISPELHDKFKDGMHSPRVYDLETSVNSKTNQSGNLIDKGVAKKRVKVGKVDDAVFSKLEKSPIMRSMVRAEIALRDKATSDALKKYVKEGLIRDQAPNNNFVKLEGARYGQYAGKYIYRPIRSEIDRSTSYKTKLGGSLGDLVDKYHDTKLGSLDRFFKATKTTLSPGTVAGNTLSNPLAFNSAAGVNPLTQSKNMVKAGAKLAGDSYGGFNRDLYEARKQGVGVDDTGKALTGDRRQELKVGSKHSKNPVTLAGHGYGAIDRAAQVALYDELISRGLTPEKAARRVANATQDYGNAGRGVQVLADAPILGKPFARFTPELLRLTKNNIAYNPLGTAAKVGVAAYGADKLSKASGETEEERQAREGAVGQTQLPGTGWINKAVTGRDKPLSLNVAVGDNSVNLARVTGLNYPIEPNGTANGALLRQLNPVADMTRTNAQGQKEFAPNQAVSSLTLRPIADQLANRDFLNRSITDPENKTYVEGVGEKGKKFAGEPSKDEKRQNRIKSALMGYAPFANETDAIKSAIQGKSDYYGKERTVPQAIARAGGVKVEKNDEAARTKRLDMNQYYEGEREQINKFLRDNPDLKDSYSKITSNTRTRGADPTKTRDVISPEKWKVVVGDTSGRLYNQLKDEAVYANKNNKDKDGNPQPIDPIFQLNDPKRAKEVTELRSRPTGDDVEREEILRATTGWYQKFEKSERDYYAANEKYYKNLPERDGADPPNQNPRVAAYGNVPHPEQPALLQQYYKLRYGDEAAGVKGDEAVGKQFYKDHADALGALTKDYKKARLTEINAKRAIEGFEPIKEDTFNNVSFGYEDDESKIARELSFKLGSGYGYGSGSSRSPKASDYIKTYSVPKEVKSGQGKQVSVRKVAVKKKASPKVSVSSKKIRLA